jgi:hypothetical protein
MEDEIRGFLRKNAGKWILIGLAPACLLRLPACLCMYVAMYIMLEYPIVPCYLSIIDHALMVFCEMLGLD